MSRLYDALKSAQATLPTAALPLRAQQPVADGAILRLAQAIDSRLFDRPRRVIQVIGCTSAEDAAGVVRRLANLSVLALRRTTMVLDCGAPPVAAKPTAGHPAIAGLPPLPAFEPSAPPLAGEERPFTTGRLLELTEGASIAPQKLRALWRQLREAHDLVLIDSPPVSDPVGLAVAPTVDGVILVLEADKTRVTTARTARETLIGGGANLIGVVLDKRRYRVPRFLWELL